MKQVLTSLAWMGTALLLNAQTQILNYGFEASDQLPGVVDTVNLYQAWKDAGGTFSYQGTPAYEGEYAFSFNSPSGTGAAGGAWERVLRFTNLPLQENTSYRVSFYAQATDNAQMGVAIMRGELEADMPLVCAPTTEDGSAVQQKTTLTGFSNGQYLRKTAVFWSPSLAVQQERYNEVKSTGTLPDGVFLRLSFLTEGSYLIDNVVVEEASIAGATFNGDAILIDFGYPTNGAELAAKAGGTAVVSSDAFKVTVDGEIVTPESVEIKKDGSLCIFLNEDVYLTDESKVTVSYDGSISDLVYSTTVAPESWTNPNRTVLPFTDEVAYFDGLLDVVSVAFEEAEFVSADPEDGSFELSEDINEFTFTYNKEIYTSNAPEGDATAVLTNALGFSEALAIKPGQPEISKSITFVRTGTDPLAKAEYTITVNNISNAKGVSKEDGGSVSFEVGKVTVSSTTYTELLSVNFDADGGGVIPTGWTVNNEGEERASGSSQGSGPRTFTFPAGGDVTTALYLRAKWPEGQEAPNEGSALYGDLEGYELIIPAGQVQLTVPAFLWKNSGSIGIEVKKYEEGKSYAESETVASTTALLSNNAAGDNTQPIAADKPYVRFTSDGGRYLLKVSVINETINDNWIEIMFGGFTVYSYVETAGESSDARTLFEETFASTADNYTPAAGTGWEIYDENVLLNKGQSYSGAGSRIFKTSATNLPSAYYSRVMTGDGSTYYAIYGNGGEGEPTLTLEQGKTQITYYGANWKSNLQMCHFLILNENDEVVYSREDTLTANLNSNKSTVVDANKIQFNYVVPETGTYKLKYWFSSEAMVGNISIKTVGSQAVYYKNLLKEALDAAIAEQEHSAEEIYAGATYTALSAAIVAYTDPDFHTPTAYKAAIAELESLTKAMATRRTNVAVYQGNLEAAAAALSAADATKYARLEAYTTLNDVYSSYVTINSADLNDEMLIAANEALTASTTLLNNMMNECVDLLTAQLAQAAAQIVALDATQDTDENVIAAGDALTDDQELMRQLKLKLTATIYQACVAGNPFEVYNEEYQQTLADSLDLTCMIQNADLYTTSLVRDNITETENLFPGWTVTRYTDPAVGVGFSWNTFNGSASHPITDAYLVASWGPNVDLTQTLEIVPVGVYSISAGTEDSGDRVSTADSAFVRSTFRYEMESKSDTMLFNNSDRGTYYDLSRAIFANVPVPAVGEEVYGSITYGANIRTYQSICAIDAFKLHMTGKLDGFDYASAAAKVLDEYAAGISQTYMPTETPQSVRYYNLSGAVIAQPAGICVKIERYTNGYVVVKKIVVK
jgi:hypothetical protein